MPEEIRHLDPVRRKKLVALLCCTVFCSVLNGTMFNVAVPDIAIEFALQPTQVSWVITGYIVLFALGSMIFGKLADSYPIRQLIVIGLVLFNLGALIGLASNWYPMLLVARLVQASGGSAIPALAMLVATRFVPPGERGAVLGAVASTVALAAGIGPIIGGFIAGEWHWRFLFLISLLTLAAIPYYLRLLPKEQLDRHPFDAVGALLIGLAAVMSLIFLTRSRLLALPIALIAFGLFLVRIHRLEHPFVSPALLRHIPFVGGLLTTFLAIGTFFGMLFQTPLLLREVYQLDTHLIGLTIFPGAMSATLLGFLGGRLADKKGSALVVFLGLGFLTGGFLLLGLLAGSGVWLVGSVLVICYCGFALIHASLAKTVSMILPPAQTGAGMGLYNLVFFMSGAFGTALTSQLIEKFNQTSPWSWLPRGAAASFSQTFMVSAITCLLAMGLFALLVQRLKD